jgi:beta-galactosidase
MNAHRIRSVACLVAGLLAAQAALAPSVALADNAWVWLEGEKFDAANVEVDVAGRGHKEFMSAGTWAAVYRSGASVREMPDDGAILAYTFALPAGGKHELWARVGYSFLRSRFAWRIDDGPWQVVEPDALTVNNVDVAQWCPLGWLRLGEPDLGSQAGKHTLEFRCKPYEPDRRDGKKGRPMVRFALDAICLHPGTFRPNGRHKPNAEWRTEQDRQAEAKVYRLPDAFDADLRARAPLTGLWQYARWDEDGLVKGRTKPIASLPDADALRWTSLTVPGDRNAQRVDLAMNHRGFYRTRVHVPDSHKGRRLWLHFEQTSLMATVFVNGRQVGFQDLPFVPWACEITEAVKVGEVNEIWVGIKDWVYAYSPSISGRNTRYFYNQPRSMSGAAPVDYAFRTIGGFRTGLIEEVQLVSVARTHVSDVFAIPSVKDKTLTARIELTNRSASPARITVENVVVPAGGGDIALKLPDKSVTLAAGKTETLEVAADWANPRLWWPADPHLYEIVTVVRADGRAIDASRTTFGFRQWEIVGDQLVLNGVPQTLRADLTYYGYDDHDIAKGISVDDVFETWKRNGQNMFRFRFQPDWGGMGDGEMLSHFDRHGVNVRRNVSRLDGQVFNTAIWYKDPQTGKSGPNVDLFRNYTRQAVARVKAERNHPAIFVWELDNESIMLWGMGKTIREGCSPHFAETAKAIEAVDPTRPVLTGGGVALAQDQLDIYGVHYFCINTREYPDEAYSLDKCFEHHRNRRGFPITEGDKPLFMSEEYYMPGKPPAYFAAIGGEGVFSGRPSLRRAADVLGRMFSEGYRWGDVAGFHYWGTFGEQTYNSWQPVAALCRQWNWTFAGGAEVRRTIKVLNDTPYDDPVEVAWSVSLDGKKLAGETFAVRPQRGDGVVKELRFALPDVDRRTKGQFTLSCRHRGQEVYRDARTLWALDLAAPKPSLARDELAVLDPSGEVTAYLKRRGIDYTPIGSADKTPAAVKVLLVGRNAVDGDLAANQTLMTLAAQGKRVIVLEQETPFSTRALPADLEPTRHAGRAAFIENAAHPILAGLGADDLWCWAGEGDHVVYRNAYRKSTRGSISLLQCDEGLECTALTECPVNDGIMIVSQLAIAEKLRIEPTARKLLGNLLAYAATYAPAARPVGVCVADPRKRAALDRISLRYAAGDDPLEMLRSGEYEVLVVEATPDRLARLASAKDDVTAWTAKGNWLMLWGLTPEGLDDYNRLLGVEHLLRPFRLEKLQKIGADPLLAGVSTSDLRMSTTKKFHRHTGQTFLDWNVFNYVVDYDDVAPFASWPAPSYFGSEHAETDYFDAMDNLPLNMVNGMTPDEYWVYGFSIHLYDQDPTTWTVALPRQETLTEFSVVVNRTYHEVTKLRVTFNDEEKTALTFDIADEAGRQDFRLPDVRASKVTFEIVDWALRGTRDVIGIGNIWLRAKRSEEFRRKVTPLLNVGGLMKYPRGKGGIVLNQLKLMDTEARPENADKKRRILRALLRNVGADFDAARVVLPGMGLRYSPVNTKDHVNLFLDSDHNWPDKQSDLARLPVGKQRFLGVAYDIYEYKTALFPHAITLKGAAKVDHNDLPLPSAVRGIEVGAKADAVFFLHTILPVEKWTPPRTRRGQQPPPPPTIFRYVVTYADGKQRNVDVRLAEQAHYWLQRGEIDHLPGASVAWTGKARGPYSAAIYQMNWTNPRPNVAIQSIDVEYVQTGPDGQTGQKWGAPVVLAITTAIEP